MINLLPRCGNLLQNPSFESGLSFWQADNVMTTDTSPAEGTQVASLGPGVASLYQDVALGPWQKKPLFLSFIVYARAVDPGDLVAEVLWLDINGIVIGTGLRAFLPSSSISGVRNTFFDVTDRPPLNAVWARLLFSKAQSELALFLDLVNLFPVESPNLVSNPSFELGLAEWDAAGFSPFFSSAWEGVAEVRQSGAPGTLSQDILLNPFRPGAAYLLSFAAESIQASSVAVQLVWLNVLGNPIGTPGIDITIVPATLSGQGKYLNFVQLSGPAPVGAVQARLIFTASGAVGSILELDQVILVRLDAPNLLQNPGFASGLDSWTSVGVTAQNTGGYIGQNFVLLSNTGALINQTVALPQGSTCHCFLVNFALHYTGEAAICGIVLAQVYWLDVLGNEIGLGLAIVVSQPNQQQDQWLVYTGVTERVPLGAVFVRIQFTKSEGTLESSIGLDSVTFARVD